MGDSSTAGARTLRIRRNDIFMQRNKLKDFTPPPPEKGLPRESNMELFRIVAMLLVLGIHACWHFIGEPNASEIVARPVEVFTRSFFRALCCGCVDMFVMLSGWYGIRPKTRSFCKFLFQALFCSLGVYAVFVMAGLTDFSVTGLGVMCFFGKDEFWFVKAYIGLYILSPLLNAFVEMASRKQLETFLIGYFVFQLLYGWLSPFAANFSDGFSTMSFIFLYMLLRYVRLYHEGTIARINRHYFLCTFFGIALLQALLYFAGLRHGMKWLGMLFSYTSPTVIVMSLLLLVWFSRLSFNSKIVNLFAASAFSVYLLHAAPRTLDRYFIRIDNYLFDNLNGVPCILAIIGLVIATYVVLTLVDQLRVLCWNMTWNYLKRFECKGLQDLE